jgi:hypothetical protein
MVPAPPCHIRKKLVITAAIADGIKPKNNPEMLNNMDLVSKTTPGENGNVENITAIPNPPMAIPDKTFSPIDLRLDRMETIP